MVKRHNKTGRRQILQLVDKKPQPPTVAASSHKPQVSRSLTYYSDSDEEGEHEAPVPSASEAPSGPIDSQVADFLKEIDALSATKNSEAASSETDSKPATVEDALEESNIKQNATLSEKTENMDSSCNTINGESVLKQDPSEVYCVWQQCHDENSGYSYFWNVMTNEVTWDCPPEYLAYQKYLNAHAAQSPVPSTSTKSKSTAKKAQKKHDAILKEGAIIPISYFGGSSASESSDEADSQNSPGFQKVSASIQKASSSQASSLLNSKHKNQAKSKLSKKGSAEAMGPQLPPNFQFPEDVPLSPSQSNTADSACDVSSVIVGLQLPAVHNLETSEQDVDTNVQSENLTSENQCSSSQSSYHVSNVDSSGSEDKLKDPVLTEKLTDALDKNSIQDGDASNSEDVPDSTTKKEMNSSKLNEDDLAEVSPVMGCRPVVEYYSFSDTDEEMEAACSSSSKHHVSKIKASVESVNSCTPVTESLNSQFSPPKETSSADGMEFECSTSSEVALKSIGECSNNGCAVNVQMDVSESIGNDIENDAEAFCSSENETQQNEDIIHHKKPYDRDIVSNMFSFAKETSGKFGFGFSKSKQLELENEAFGVSEQNSGSQKKHNKGYPIISFVKSRQVLDLNVINDSQIYQEKEASEKEKTSSVNKGPCAVPCSSKMAEINSINNELHCKTEAPLVSGLNEKPDTKKHTEQKIEKSAPSAVVVKERDVIVTQKIDDSKKCKVKKKHGNKSKKEVKEGEQVVAISKQDSSTSDDKTGVDDIDQLLGSILKEMVESGDSSSQASAASKKQQETKKRHQSVPLASPVKKKKKAVEPKEAEEKSDDVMTHIIELATVLLEKMTFLVTNNSSMVSLSSLLVQIQTRLVDWQAGALDSKYFMDRLQEVQQYLQHYEMSVVTGDWTCQWDRENKRYFYVNERNQHSQWTYPSEAVAQSTMHNKAMWSNHSSEIAMSSNVNFQTSGTQFPLVSSSISEEQVHKANVGPSSAFAVQNEECDHDSTERGCRSTSSWLRQRAHEASPPPPPPGVDTPPPLPPPPITPPPENPPPPPPPDSTEVKDSEIPDVDMDLEDSNSSDSVSFTRNIVKSHVSEPQQTGQIPPKHFFSECTSTKSPERQSSTFSTGVVSSTSASHSETAVIAKPPQPVTLSSGNSAFSASSGMSIQPTWVMPSSVPSCSSAQTSYLPPNNSEIAALPVGTSSSQKYVSDEIGTSSPAQECSSPTYSSNISSNKSSVSVNNNSVSTSKKEKKKPKLRTGLSFKKKNIPSLVQKWQKIKEEQEKEDKNSDDAKLTM